MVYYVGEATKKIQNKETYIFTLKIERKNDRKNDCFSYRVQKKQGIISGNNERSVLLGVYAYLRDIGIEFLYPGKQGDVIPTISSYQEIEKMETRLEADYFHRGICIEGANSLENVLNFIEWMPKMGFNSFFIQFKKPDTFFERWYHHIFNPILEREEKSRRDLDTILEQMIKAINKRGLMIHRVGHGWTAECLGYDSRGWQQIKGKLSPKVHSMAAMIKGRRELWKGIPANTNLCYSSEIVKEEISQLVVQFAKKEKNLDYLHFWLADEANNICECEECKKSLLSDQYVEILNRIDKKMEKEKLNTKIVFLLYQELLYAPQKEFIKNPERFCLMFAPISRDFENTYPSELLDVKITPYVRNRFILPQKIDENLRMYRLWMNKYKGEVFFYDYPLGRAHYGDFGYMKIARIIFDDLKKLKNLGSQGYMSCQELRITMPTGFPNYVMGNCLLHKDCDFQDLKNRYFTALYGNVKEECISYLQALSDLSDMNYFNGHGSRIQPILAENFKKIVMQINDFLPEIDKLKREVTPQNRANLDYLRIHGEYSRILARALYHLCRGEEENAKISYIEFCSYVRRMETEIQQYLDVYRIIEVTSTYTGFQLDI